MEIAFGIIAIISLLFTWKTYRTNMKYKSLLSTIESRNNGEKAVTFEDALAYVSFTGSEGDLEVLSFVCDIRRMEIQLDLREIKKRSKMGTPS